MCANIWCKVYSHLEYKVLEHKVYNHLECKILDCKVFASKQGLETIETEIIVSIFQLQLLQFQYRSSQFSFWLIMPTHTSKKEQKQLWILYSKLLTVLAFLDI